MMNDVLIAPNFTGLMPDWMNSGGVNRTGEGLLFSALLENLTFAMPEETLDAGEVAESGVGLPFTLPQFGNLFSPISKPTEAGKGVLQVGLPLETGIDTVRTGFSSHELVMRNEWAGNGLQLNPDEPIQAVGAENTKENVLSLETVAEELPKFVLVQTEGEPGAAKVKEEVMSPEPQVLSGEPINRHVKLPDKTQPNLLQKDFSDEKPPVPLSNFLLQRQTVMATHEMQAVHEVAEMPELPPVTQIAEKIEVFAEQGSGRYVVELTPVELGKVIVELQLVEGKLTLAFKADNPVTQSLLAANTGELKTLLEANTARLVDFRMPTEQLVLQQQPDEKPREQQQQHERKPKPREAFAGVIARIL